METLSSSLKTEDYWGNVNPIGPRACYDEGKRVAEALCMAYFTHHDVDIRIARIFNTYGPFMDPEDGRVVSNFIVQVLNGEKISIYGDGSQTRSFCYVDDLVEGLIKLMNSGYNMPVNLGNPNEFTIKELAELVSEKLHVDYKVKNEELPIDDPKVRCPDISKAKSLLHWNPKIELNQGLNPTIEWFRKAINE